MLPDTTPQNETVIACDPSGISPEEMDRWMTAIIPQVYRAVQEIRELPDGWALRLPSTSEVLMLVAEDIDMERRCCPFVHYTLEAPPNKASFWYRLTGVEGVKDFLRMAFEATIYFDAEVMKAVGWDVSAARDLNSVDEVLEAVETLNERFANSTA